MSHAASKPTHTHCQNCKAELKGPFCHACGQKDLDFHRSLGHVLHEVIETWLHLDHTFFREIYNILLRPGKTTKEFNEGKRARHTPPFRFYLVVSLFFFFLIIPSHQELEEQATHIRIPSSQSHAPKISSEPMASGSGVSAGWKEAFARELFEHPAETNSKFFHNLPRALLACLPLFAFITRIMYRGSGYVYIQHLILAFNLHSSALLWWSFTFGWSKIAGLFSTSLEQGVVSVAQLLTCWVYFRALKDVFERSWPATLALGALTVVIYSVLLSVFIAGTVLVTVLI